jgi:hypothetical protein
MSPRGKGRNGGNNNKQSSDKKNHSGKQSSDKSDKSVTRWKFHLGTAQQALSYQKIFDHHITELQSTLEHGAELVESMRTLTTYDVDANEPQLLVSTNQDPVIQAIEQKKNNINYQLDMEEYKKFKITWKSNCSIVFGYIWKNCNNAMQSKVKARPEYKTALKDNNVIQLLKLIKEYSLDLESNRLPHEIAHETLQALFTAKQSEVEELSSWCEKIVQR